MSTYIRIALLVVVSLMAAAGAQAAPAAKEKEASRLFFGGRFGEALAIYVDLAVETSNPIYMCEIGRCHQRLGNLIEARRNVSECLAAAKLTPAKKRQFQAVLAEIDAAAARAPAAATAPAPPPPAATPGAPASDPLAAPAPASPLPPTAAPVAEATPPAPAPPAALPGPAQPAWNPGPYGQYGAPPAHLQQGAAAASAGGASWKRPTAYVAGAIGLVGVSAGVYSGLNAKKKFDQVVRVYDDEAYKQGKKFNTYQMIGYGVGAAGLGTAVVLFLTSSGGGEPRTAMATSATSDHRLSLMVGHDGLAVAGSF
jgi:hypothetical protein